MHAERRAEGKELYFPIKIMTFLRSSDPKTSGQAPTAASEGNAALRAFVLFCVWGFDCF